MSVNQDLEYDDVADALQRGGASCSASECHGFVCGLICGSGFADPKIWVGEFFEDFNPRDVLQKEAFGLLQKLYESMLGQLNSPDLDFELLLPDDSQPLPERTEALANWCSGFLAGLGMAGRSDQTQLADDVQELLRDLAEFSRVDFDFEDAGEQEQVAFEELAEYIRVGILYVYEELQPGTTPATLQ
ncbi:MAG: UPF0149 family protein [Thiogranum sp.]|nr:UPF0149 family protein [Thiogranum sp.]